MNKQTKIQCPVCRKDDTYHLQNAYRPFCSERCKLIDLGEWASENRKIPSEATEIKLDLDDLSI